MISINRCSLIHGRQLFNQITRIRYFQVLPAANGTSDPFDDRIRGFSKQGLPEDALLVFRLMRQRGVQPSNFTYPFAIKASASLVALKKGIQLHGDALKHGFHSCVYVGNSLIHLYGCCGDIVGAYKMFDEISVRTLVSWNSIIGSCVDNSLFKDALGLFSGMRSHGLDPDQTTMVALLSSSAKQGNLSLGRWAHCQVVITGLSMNCQLGTALVEMYAKCGNLNYARLIFDQICDKNVWTWSAMILGLAQHGHSTEALNLYSEMENNTSVSPNHVTFLGVLCACSHGGLINDGYWNFHEMEHVYGIKPTLAHYGSMVDMLCRAGFLNEAYHFVQNMRVKPDAVVWRTLLNACSLHRVDDEVVTKAIESKLMELEPERIGNSVIIANKYSSIGMWEEAAVCRSGSNKVAGESCVELEGFVHRFVSGGGSLKNQGAVFKVLDGLHLHMSKVKYVNYML